MGEPEIRYTTTADGVGIAYYTMGEGHPLLVVSTVLWSHLRLQVFREYHRSRSGQGLGRGLQIVRYDARGTGLSDRQDLDFSIDARILDLEAVVERLKLTRFAIFGLGSGTPAAITYAANHPDRVSHLILADPYVRGRDLRQVLGSWESLRGTADEEWERYTLTMANASLGFSDSASARKAAALFREAMTPESMHGFVASLETIDVTSFLSRVAVPTLIMYSAFPGNPHQLEWSREVASKIPDARFVTFSARDDLSWMDQQRRAAEEFLGVNQDISAGVPADAVGPSPFRTVLFTDIVGHTEMMQRLGDTKGRDVLREHERITRETLKAHGGAEVKTMGDGFMASFASVTAAVECAIALQRGFSNFQHQTSKIQIRVGLNAGEPIEEDGDLFGATVILASRIAAKAGPGEILVPDTVRGLLSGKNFLFSDRGEFVPKGFDDAVRLYEVRWREEGGQWN